MIKALALSTIMFLSGCAYYEQATGTASAYYDAKVSAWFKGACALNIGAVGKMGERKRTIVIAACPSSTEPIIK